MVAQVRDAWGTVDMLVANAGGGRGRPADTMASTTPPDLFDLVLKMNLYGTYHCCSAVAPLMKAQRSGRIVTVASYAGKVAGIGGGYAHYGSAKAAIAHYTRYLAQELGPYGINANCIAPRVIVTARIVKLIGGSSRGNEAADDIALRRYGTPEDCAKVVEFLVTDLSDYVTGALIPIDGG
jgi:3-oxoacyl-[acyl-carrier protein] reductase